MKIRLLRPSFILVCTAMLSLIFAAALPDAQAQNDEKIVRGIVLDEENNPILGAGVLIKGTQTGTVTDIDGRFELEIPEQKAIIEVSFLGYNTQEVTVTKGRQARIVLYEDKEFLDAVVVVAYGTQTKATVTGALSTIEPEKLTKTPVADITNVLAGQIPGVATVQTTGQPGNDNAQIFIRGVSSLSKNASTPLILVDGVERPMANIDPNEIESFSILKDASSTAVFGVRGANGVILVTTRRGKVGKPSISFTTTNGIQQPTSYVEQVGSYEYATFWNQKMLNDHITDPKKYFTREAIEAYRIGSDPIMFPSMNWGDEVFRDAFFQTQNNINLSGGTENVRYFISLGYMFQDGILKKLPSLGYDNNYKYNRYNLRANLDFNLSPTTTMKFNLGGIVGVRREPRVAEGIDWGWVYTKIWTVPMSSPGIVNGMRTFVAPSMTPLGFMRDGYGAFYGWGFNENYSGNINLDVDITQSLDCITDGLSISAKGGFDSRMRLNKYHIGYGMETQTVYYKTHLEDNSIPITDPDYDNTHVYVPYGQPTPLKYKEDSNSDRNWYMEFRLNYNRTFNSKHSVTALLLYNMSKDHYPREYWFIPRSYVGFVGRVTYGYKNRYLFDINAGYNGSENFAPGKTRYGFFPSMSVGYVMSEEPFMKKQNVIDFLKFRFSAGKVGNDLGTASRFMYMQSVWNPGGNYSFGVNNPEGIPYYLSGTPGNKDVSWETSVKYNVGVDMEMFKKRLRLTAEYFFEDRSDILITPKSTPPIIATTLPNLNLGEVHNQGYEISIGWGDRFANSFSYNIDANVSYARNKIIYMDEVKTQWDYQTQTGGPTGRYTGLYKFERLYQPSDFVTDSDGQQILDPSYPQPSLKVYPGDAMYADLNKDGIINGNDTMVDGYSTRPEYIFGLNGQFSYKGFSLSMNWIGATHVNKMMEIEYRIPFTNAGTRGLLDYLYHDCWSPTNPSGTLPRAAETTETWNSQNSTLWLKDASYIRLKTLTLGYTFKNNRFFKKIGLSSLGITLTGYNLLTFSPLKFEDPETITDNLGQYPMVKTFNLGLKLNF